MYKDRKETTHVRIGEEDIHHHIYMLGSKPLGNNVLELHFVLCWQTMIKT